MRRLSCPILAACALLPLLAGCADLDPYLRPYRWQPEGAVQANLANQLADPLDLVRGRGEEGNDGTRAAAAVAKWNKEGPGGGKSLEGVAGSMSAGGGR